MTHREAHESGSRKAVRVRRQAAERSKEAHEWTRDHFMHDLARASRRITQDIESDAAQASALDRSRQQARDGDLISEADFDAENEDR